MLIGNKSISASNIKEIVKSDFSEKVLNQDFDVTRINNILRIWKK